MLSINPGGGKTKRPSGQLSMAGVTMALLTRASQSTWTWVAMVLEAKALCRLELWCRA